MTTPELIQFVKNELAAGSTRNIIAAKLEKEGWTALDIIDVFNIIEPKKDEVVVPLPKEPTVLFVQPQKKKKSYKLLLIIILVIVVGGVLAYGSGYLTFSSKLFSNSLSSIRGTEGVTIDMHIATDTFVGTSVKSEEEKGFKVIDLVFKGSFNLADKNNLKSDTTFNLKLDDKEVAMHSLAIDKSLYMNISKVPDLGSVSLESMLNKWIVFPSNSGLGNLSSNPLAASTGFGSQIIKDLNVEQKKNIYDITDRASFIKVTKKHLPKMVDGSLTYHFDFDLDREGVSSYFKEILSYLRNTENGSELSALKDSDYTKIVESIENFHGEMWVGVFDNLPHKLVVSGEIINKESGDTKFSMEMLTTNWGEPVIVNAPKASVSSEELFASLFGGSDNTVDTNTEIISEDPNDVSKKNILTKMRGTAEDYYSDVGNNTYKGFCKNKTDGAYLLAITLPKNSIYKCNDNDMEWAAWVKLSTNKYWCNDSKNYSNISTATSLGTSCL